MLGRWKQASLDLCSARYVGQGQKSGNEEWHLLWLFMLTAKLLTGPSLTLGDKSMAWQCLWGTLQILLLEWVFDPPLNVDSIIAWAVGSVMNQKKKRS